MVSGERVDMVVAGKQVHLHLCEAEQMARHVKSTNNYGNVMCY